MTAAAFRPRRCRRAAIVVRLAPDARRAVSRDRPRAGAASEPRRRPRLLRGWPLGEIDKIYAPADRSKTHFMCSAHLLFTASACSAASGDRRIFREVDTNFHGVSGQTLRDGERRSVLWRFGQRHERRAAVIVLCAADAVRVQARIWIGVRILVRRRNADFSDRTALSVDRRVAVLSGRMWSGRRVKSRARCRRCWSASR